MTSVNKVILIGNLGKNPSIHSLDNGSKFAAFSLATTSSWKTPSGERKSDTSWHNILCYDALANIASQYLEKGLCVYIEGRLSNRQKTDANGHKFYTTSIIAESINILTPKGYKSSQPDFAPAPQHSSALGSYSPSNATQVSEVLVSQEELVALGFTSQAPSAPAPLSAASLSAQANTPWNPSSSFDTDDDIPF